MKKYHDIYIYIYILFKEDAWGSLAVKREKVIGRNVSKTS